MIANAWDDLSRPWPKLVYMSTTNLCNARCVCCVNHMYKKIRGIMSLDNFKTIANKIKANGSMLGSMFCWGEPLMDPSLFEKCAYARSIGVMTPTIGFNTNVSLLTSEKFQPLLDHTPNITLSFFSTEAEYEYLTKLNWETSYRNALAFIAYRDVHKPDYLIRIGCNRINGHNLEKVQQAFAGKNVVFEQDAELHWGEAVLTGPLGRLVTFPHWRCDGHSGCIQVLWNGDCEICAYDVVGTDERCGETKFGNMLTDSWETLKTNWLRMWKEGSHLCKRCDYWHHADVVIANVGKLPDPLPKDWDDWKKPYEV